MDQKKIIIGLVILILVLNASFIAIEIRLREESRVEILQREHRISQLSQLEKFDSTWKQAGYITEKIAQGLKEKIRCSTVSCLTPGSLESSEPYGVATVYGYYASTKQVSGGKSLTCDSVAVTSAPANLTTFFSEVADRWSGYSKVKDDQVAVAIDYSTLDETKKKLLLDSGKDAPLKMLILKKTDDGSGGTDGCYSPMGVLNVWEAVVEKPMDQPELIEGFGGIDE